MQCMKLTSALLFTSMVVLGSSGASAVPVTLSSLTGTTGGSPAQTGVFRADLSVAGLGNIQSITIKDSSFGLGGAGGQFSGFDLDAIILSNTFCSTSFCAAGLTGLSVFDYSAGGTVFTPGSQRLPADPKLFGTDGTGTDIDNAIATLGLFDGNSTTAIPGADGFVSMGDGGVLSFNLTSAVATSGLYMYLGEVGDNGEVASGQITVSDQPVTDVPEPGTISLMLAGLLALMGRRRKPG
ncbi:MAG: PEP-CTERM sorting domain-containing protein [Pseudomonadota bacterium]|nr:PEP-CTERM sorting domain-containing protein [Pseudomonadota bacterium]